MRDHDLRTAGNGCVSCKRCGLILSPLEARGVIESPACYERVFAPSDPIRHHVE